MEISALYAVGFCYVIFMSGIGTAVIAYGAFKFWRETSRNHAAENRTNGETN